MTAFLIISGLVAYIAIGYAISRYYIDPNIYADEADKRIDTFFFCGFWVLAVALWILFMIAEKISTLIGVISHKITERN